MVVGDKEMLEAKVIEEAMQVSVGAQALVG